MLLHGRLHRFQPEDPWCTATWIAFTAATEGNALAAKYEAYGDAQFLHQLPTIQQLEVIEASEARQ